MTIEEIKADEARSRVGESEFMHNFTGSMMGGSKGAVKFGCRLAAIRTVIQYRKRRV